MKPLKTKPFDLFQALNGVPVVTRDGRRAKIWQLPSTTYNRTVSGVIEGNAFFSQWYGNGRYHYSINDLDNDIDLFLVDEEPQHHEL